PGMARDVLHYRGMGEGESADRPAPRTARLAGLFRDRLHSSLWLGGGRTGPCAHRAARVLGVAAGADDRGPNATDPHHRRSDVSPADGLAGIRTAQPDLGWLLRSSDPRPEASRSRRGITEHVLRTVRSGPVTANVVRPPWTMPRPED